ncbi:hypothetical protein LXL04_021204 [Taraxacum kok-saghyz]
MCFLLCRRVGIWVPMEERTKEKKLSSSSGRQVKAMLRKNWFLKIRHPYITLAEFRKSQVQMAEEKHGYETWSVNGRKKIPRLRPQIADLEMMWRLMFRFVAFQKKVGTAKRRQSKDSKKKTK